MRKFGVFSSNHGIPQKRFPGPPIVLDDNALKLFFVSPELVFKDKLVLAKRDSHHIRDVLRMKAGDMLAVSDGRTFLYRSRIMTFDTRGVVCAICGQEPLPPMSPPCVTLIQAVPKGPRMDWLVQKVTELGVQEIIPVYMGRSIGVAKGEKAVRRQSRWYRIATDAAKQCGRMNIPRIEAPSSLSAAMDRIPNGSLPIFCDEKEEGRSLRDLRNQVSDPGAIVLLVGPEGGTTDDERELISQHGFHPVTLGELILRTETAGIFSVGLVRYEWRTQAGMKGGTPS